MKSIIDLFLTNQESLFCFCYLFSFVFFFYCRQVWYIKQTTSTTLISIHFLNNFNKKRKLQKKNCQTFKYLNSNLIFIYQVSFLVSSAGTLYYNAETVKVQDKGHPFSYSILFLAVGIHQRILQLFNSIQKHRIK